VKKPVLVMNKQISTYQKISVSKDELFDIPAEIIVDLGIADEVTSRI
jgi:hypothetical protein